MPDLFFIHLLIGNFLLNIKTPLMLLVLVALRIKRAWSVYSVSTEYTSSREHILLGFECSMEVFR